MRRPWYLVVCLFVLAACAPAVMRHNEQGNERFASDAYEEAIHEYRLAQVDEPDLPEPYYNAANAYNRLGELDSTLLQTEQALKTAGSELSEEAWYNLGNAYFDAGRWPESVEAYKEALRLQPDDLEAKHNLELALQRLKEQQQTQQQDQQAQQDEQQERDDPPEDTQQTEPSSATPTPQGEQEPLESEQMDEGQASQPTPAAQPEDMTEEEALQLLGALLSDSQTLQERLQEIHQVPGPVPEQDW